jgi:drug/metabolite transporter (DMT)-like permease
MLAVAARPEAAKTFSLPVRVTLLCGVVVVAIVGAIAGRQRGPGSAAGLAVAAGLGFAGLGIAARALVLPHSLWRLLSEPLAWAIAGYGVLATLLFATALQRGSVTTAAALTFAVETVVPTVVGVLLLGDRARPSLAPLAAAGFVLAVTGAISLARHAATPPQQPALTTGL